jgi:hypothetical protein
MFGHKWRDIEQVTSHFFVMTCCRCRSDGVGENVFGGLKRLPWTRKEYREKLKTLYDSDPINATREYGEYVEP